MRNLIFILIVILALPAIGQKRKQTEAGATPVFTEGITYALPRTGLEIYVEAVKEIFEPGPYAPYAPQLLGITNARNTSSVKWVISNVEFDTFTEPDPDQVYKAIGDAAFLVDLTPSGCLAGVNSDRNLTEGMQSTTFTYISKELKEDDFDFSRFNHSPFYTQGDSTNNYRPVRVSEEDKAVEAARRILESRNTRFQIASGLLDEFHPDGKAYEVSIKELEKIEQDYLSLFTGRTKYEKQKFGFNFIPASSSEKGEVVFRFSEEGGVLPATNLSGKPVMLRIEPEKALISKYTKLAVSDNPDAGSSGLFYRMPVVANVHLIYELNTIASTRILLPQFGQVAPIPEELLFGEYRIEIHPETGAVKSIIKK